MIFFNQIYNSVNGRKCGINWIVVLW